MADLSEGLQNFAQTYQRGQDVDPFFSKAALDILGGPSMASLPGIGSSATSAATGTHTATISTPFVQSSPFILGNDNKSGDVGTGSTTGGAAASGARSFLSKLTDALGPAATLATLAVALIALVKVVR